MWRNGLISLRKLYDNGKGVAIAHTPGASAAQFRVAGYPILGTVALLLMEVQQIVQRRISHQPASARAASLTCRVD